MAIISVTETLNNRTVTARMRDTSSYTRSFVVKVDNPGESWNAISLAPPVRWGDYHPEDTSVVAAQMDIRPSGDLLLYEVVWTYEAPAAVDALDAGATQPPPPGGGGGGGGRPVDQLPADLWSGTTSLNAVPVTKSIGGTAITNSAGVPIPDQTALRPFGKLELTRSYDSLATIAAEIATYTGTINAAAWAGGAAKTWLCEGCRWQKQSQSTGGSSLIFYSATWSFSYDGRGWILEPIDRGYMELVGGRLRNIIDPETGSPVADPVPLSGGVAAPGTMPTILRFDIYPTANFNYWGSPV